jgi:hypothetical protein
MPTQLVKGSTALTVGTEATLATETAIGTYVMFVDASPLWPGDQLEARIYTEEAGEAAPVMVFRATLCGAQNTPMLLSVPIPNTTTIKFTLLQAAGTPRMISWAIDTL